MVEKVINESLLHVNIRICASFFSFPNIKYRKLWVIWVVFGVFLDTNQLFLDDQSIKIHLRFLNSNTIKATKMINLIKWIL